MQNPEELRVPQVTLPTLPETPQIASSQPVPNRVPKWFSDAVGVFMGILIFLAATFIVCIVGMIGTFLVVKFKELLFG